jgi:serine phosphatase RsbU (regulator of sigma subunit)/pSer/pThr/pTyr-binding forkhead associated (FHA) protein
MTNPAPALVGSQEGVEIRFPLMDGRNVVGRAVDCQLVLGNPSVSRHHAALLCSGGRVLVEDLGSHNGTRVNDMSVTTPTPLSVGDTVAFADVVLHFGEPRPRRGTLTLDPHVKSEGIAVSWDEVRGQRRTGQSKRAELFRCLAGAGDLLTVPRAPEELFEPILDLVESAMNPDRAFLLLVEDGRREPAIRASRLRGGGDGSNVKLSQTMVSRVLEEHTSFLLEDVDASSDIMQQQSIISQGIRSAMATPLFDNKAVIGILYADTTDPTRHYTRDELVAFSLLANVIAVALTHASYDAMEAEKRRLDTELDAARSILQTIIPDTLPAIPGFEVCAHIEPCFEVGGDLYDVSALPDGRVALIVGDVAGKGLGAALLVSSLVPLLRAMLEAEPDLAALTANLNRQLWRITDPVRYSTLFVGVLDPMTGRFEYVNAGHNPPVLVRADGVVESISSTGLPVALVDEGVWRTAELSLLPGDLLALYSDGIPETWQDEETDYGDERFQQLLVANRSLSVPDICQAALLDVSDFRGDEPVGDDITLLLLRRLAG